MQCRNDEDEGSDDDDSDGAKIIYDPGRSNWFELDLLPIDRYCRLIWHSVFLLNCQPCLLQFVVRNVVRKKTGLCGGKSKGDGGV